MYGVFSTTSEVASSSAICRYRVDDIERDFEKSDALVYNENDGSWMTEPFGTDRDEVQRQVSTG